MSDISVRRVSGLGMVTLRGDLTLLAQAVGLPVPGLRLSSRAGGEALLWMSPDELLLVCGDGAGRAREMSDTLAGTFTTVADVSDARAVFSVTGPGAQAALARLCPVDFARLDPAEVRRTRLAQVAAALWREGDDWRVVCFASVADYVQAALTNAAKAPLPPLAAS